ncbi:hypothetical protein CR513_14233, partial [Mucuna pruriens]
MGIDSSDNDFEEASWILVMKEDLNQFTKNDVWTLTLKAKCKSIVVGTRQVFRTKLDEYDKAIRNKTRLVAQSYNHQEAKLEAIRNMLAFAAHKKLSPFKWMSKAHF